MMVNMSCQNKQYFHNFFFEIRRNVKRGTQKSKCADIFGTEGVHAWTAHAIFLLLFCHCTSHRLHLSTITACTRGRDVSRWKSYTLFILLEFLEFVTLYLLSSKQIYHAVRIFIFF
jgi:hypothetical protein